MKQQKKTVEEIREEIREELENIQKKEEAEKTHRLPNTVLIVIENTLEIARTSNNQELIEDSYQYCLDCIKARNTIGGTILYHLLYSAGTLFRPITKIGSGKHSRYSVDNTAKITAKLDKYGIPYTVGNDSPRGGKLGKYIKIEK